MTLENFQPLRTFDFAGDAEDIRLGEKLLAEGKAGALLLAGGQGSRLGSPVAKALVPVSLIKSKSLLQLFCEKTAAASNKAGRPLPLAVMTSPLNHAEIATYLEQNHYFGLEPQQLLLFQQEMAPLLDAYKKPIYLRSGEIAQGPNGNGGALKAFYQSGIWERWRTLGVEYVNSMLIDNPLADPFDPNLIGYHAGRELEITIKAIVRQESEEKLGIIVHHENKVRIIEYSDFPETLKYEKDSQGSFIWKLANISLFCFSMDFIKQAASVELPCHFCQKTVDLELPSGKERVLVWKEESYIFDLLAYATFVNVLLYARNETYSALKDPVSLDAVRRALLAQDQRRFAQVTGKAAPSQAFELSQAFHYPTKALLKKWKGKPLPSESYVED
jgi:UDP-N-acetylglucosamine/UDP-N-acetylgalactosamine diphosphorylase